MNRCRERSRLDVILVGRKFPDNENLGLGYVLAALKRAGFRTEMMVLNVWVDMERICRRVSETGPLLVGLSLPDGGSSFLPLGMGELLRRRGFQGHITAGGGFATLARHWLLERYAWLDSIVRFAGEVPATLLAEKLKEGEADLEAVPGLTTRQGDGKPAPVLDRTQMEIFPEHSELPEVLGHPLAHIAATRGCPGRCAYCGPAALQNLEKKEGIEGGHDRGELACAGVGGVRRRSLDNLCDEMALLWHEKGVRYFYFVDEHLLPRREDEAVDYIRQWKRGLKRRGVKEHGIGTMLRADLITRGIAGALVDAGLVRAFLGIELASGEDLKRYGRGGDPSRGLEVMTELEELGVTTICNLMLVHPYSTLGSIGEGIRFLERIDKGTFETTRMQVYHGTRLYDKMIQEGRLTGNPLRYSYTWPDGGVARFAEIFSRLRGEAFRNYSISYHVHDLWLAMALAAKISPRISMDDLRLKAREVTRDLNQLRIVAFLAALELAREGKGFAGCADLILGTRSRADAIQRRVDAVALQVLGRLSRPARLYSPMRTAAAYTLSFCLAGTSLSGCYDSSVKPPSDASEEGDAPGEDAAEALDAAREPEGCSGDEISAMQERVVQTAQEVDPCLTLLLVFHRDGADFQVYHDNYSEMQYCEVNHEDIDARVEAVRSAVSRLDLSCLTGLSVYVEGRENEQFGEMRQAAYEHCPYDIVEEGWYNIVIVVDGDGKVVDIRTRFEDHPVPPETIECIMSALEGLVFPCLADFEICPEYLIAE